MWVSVGEMDGLRMWVSVGDVDGYTVNEVVG